MEGSNGYEFRRDLEVVEVGERGEGGGTRWRSFRQRDTSIMAYEGEGLTEK